MFKLHQMGCKCFCCRSETVLQLVLMMATILFLVGGLVGFIIWAIVYS